MKYILAIVFDIVVFFGLFYVLSCFEPYVLNWWGFPTSMFIAFIAAALIGLPWVIINTQQ